MKGSVGKRIASIRVNTPGADGKIPMSQTELGKLADINASYISKVEGGKIEPGNPLLKRIADALGVTIEELLDPEYFGRPKNVLFTVVRLLNADRSLPVVRRQEAIACVQEVYRRKTG